MGQQQGQGFSLVSMTNKDVYYIDTETARLIEFGMKHPEFPQPITFTEARSGDTVTINIPNVSSLVVKEAQDANR